jgi:LacI family transcriptional regulator
MPSSLSEVARLAGVSLGTASSVLSARSGFRVSAETAARIRQAADKLDYKPNRLARALATGKTRLIALVDYDFGASFSAQLGRQFHLALSGDSYDLVIIGESTPPNAVATIVDGAICCSRDMPPGLDDALPVVQISPRPDTRQDALFLDFKPAAAQAMNALEREGCETVAFLGCDANSESCDGRLLAYREFIRQTGRCEVLIGSKADRQKEGYEALAHYVSENDWPQGIFCSNDELAVGAYRAIRETGRRVGREVAVIGCDDIGSEFFDPPLSTLAMPFEEISTIAWELLQRRIRSPELPTRIVDIRPTLVERESSRLTASL